MPTSATNPTPASRAPHPDKALLTAWLLLLLDEGESYGWALFGDLRDLGVAIEQSLAYRDLRALEGDGLVTSRWTTSEAGPQRRLYRLTRAGRRALSEHADIVRESWELHDAFVRTRQDMDLAPASRAAPGAREDDRPGARPGPELRAAWLLLLLMGSASYGYELRQELDARDIRIDPATLYRLLRRLERSRWLESRWMSPSAGPRRRLYRVTRAGRRNLEQLTALITAGRDAHRAFLDAYEAAATRSG